MPDPRESAPSGVPGEHDALRARAADAAEHYARRYPVKAAKQRPSIERQIETARSRGHDREAARLEGILDGYTRAAAGITCKDCGRPLADKNQPGYADGIGPDCYAKRQQAAS